MSDEPRKPQTTKYIVLQRRQRATSPANTATSSSAPADTPLPGAVWYAEVGHATAVNAQAAIKEVADGEGTFIAIPARSWRPLTRKIEAVKKDLWS
jgi:hypothetical protein